MTGRTLLVVVALLVVTSGCVGLGGSEGPEANPAGGSGGSSGSGAGGTGGSGGSSGGGSSTDGSGGVAGFQPVDDFEDVRTEAQMADFVDRSPFPIFRPGEYYVFEGTNLLLGESGEQTPVRMEIRSVGGGEWLDADIDVTLTRGGETATYRQSDGSIGAIVLSPELSLTQSGRAWVWLYRYNLVTDVEPRVSELSVGDTWRYESPGRDDDEPESGFTFEVTERRSYAGQSCVVVETAYFEGETSRPHSVSCLATDIGMPLYFAQYQDDGQAMVELELVEYER